MSHLLTPTTVPKWIKVTKTFSDFSAAALTNTIEIYSLPAKGVVHSVCMHATQSFTGGLIATYVVASGIQGNANLYITPSNVLQATSNTLIFPAVNNSAQVASAQNFGAVTSIKATATSTIDNLDQASQGSVDFYLLVSVLP